MVPDSQHGFWLDADAISFWHSLSETAVSSEVLRCVWSAQKCTFTKSDRAKDYRGVDLISDALPASKT
jgi:hypothetical protein